MALILRNAADLDTGQLDAVEAIYRDAFEPTLRAPFDDLLTDRFLVLLDGIMPVGFAVLRDLDTTGWVFLRYLAAGAPGRGTGTELWRLVREAMATADRTRIVFDVEDPAETGIGRAERRQRWRRIAFYLRLDAGLLPVRDYRPPHSGTPHPMLLIAADTRPGGPPVIVGDELTRTVTAVYRHRYRLADHDPLVRHTLRRSGL
jgi:hypothetical protein